MNSKTKYIFNLFVVIIIGLCAVSCSGHDPKKDKAQGMPQMPPPGVNITQIKNIKVTETEKYTGKIFARDIVDVVARVQGYLENHYFSEGAIVKQGCLLFLIEPDQYQAEVDQAQADIENVKATLVSDDKDLKRSEELIKLDYISHSSYDKALAKRDQSIAELKAKEAALKKAKLNLTYTKIYAPIMGKIGSLKVTEGNFVGPQTGVLATIVKLDPIYVTYKIPSDELTKLKLKLSQEGKKMANKDVEIILNDGTTYPYKGTVDFTDNQIDETTGTIVMRAKFPNPAGVLLPGQLCQVIVYENKENIRPAISQSVIQEDSEGKYVYILSENDAVQKQYIKVGQQSGKFWVVKDGLTKEDKIISTGLQKIRPGMKVNVMPDKTENTDDKGQN
ncbi:MAG: efflux RND transporter periplasmic adaptor subunit [Vampirovibrionia bacterium]